MARDVMDRDARPQGLSGGSVGEGAGKRGDNREGGAASRGDDPDIADWLMRRALRQTRLSDAIPALGRKLAAAGLPVARINVGGFMLHPVLGALDLTWDAQSEGAARSQTRTRRALGSEAFKNAPFYYLFSRDLPELRHRLSDPEARTRFPLFERLHEEGLTDYLALYVGFEKPLAAPLDDGVEGTECAMCSFATRDPEGFSEDDLARLRALALPIALVIKTAIADNFAQALLDTYLGRLSGRNVLTGHVQKGDGRLIDCVLWYSDLRGSTALSSELEIERYFSTINDYFDCTAEAVLDHGGEVLKFIGDGVMAIFPIDGETRNAEAMGRAAAETARDALARGHALNLRRARERLDPIAFGIGLHAGRVMHGNVGTDRRLDMTVTGPAANQVVRLETATKAAGVPVIASAEFAALCPEEMVPIGARELPGIPGLTELFALPEDVAPEDADAAPQDDAAG
ncbi:MAG: hypothetical protein CML46_06200 [Rhodobacteraceae bacterium]|nr:hypothetical protein [Paracoccaceae bacterium]MBR26516.1 hypothetical protein [Paracoccaceae bacterium]